MSKIIGIDLGTSKCCVSVVIDGRPIVIENNEGSRTTPSVVCFLNDESIAVGNSAKSKAISNAEYTVMNIKGLMGKSWSDIADSDYVTNTSYKLARDTEGKVVIKGKSAFYTPKEVTACILKKLKQSAERYLNENVEEAVITVPAYFNNAQRQATKEAGELAGLKVRRIINEPTAAALAYGLNRNFPSDKDYNIAVFDLGGGTFDITILSPGDGVFEVKSTNGNTHLGGNDFDFIIMTWLIEEFKKDERVDLRKDPTAWQRLKEAAEKAKIELSSSNETEIRLDYITSIGQIPKHINKVFTKPLFEKLSDPIFNEIQRKCEEAIKMASLRSPIEEVIMVGESCHMPKVSELVERIFGKKPKFGVNLVEAVSIGAAIQGAVLTGDIRNVLLLDVVPLSLGIEVGGLMNRIIAPNTTIPTKHSETFSTSSDNQTSVEIHVIQGNRSLAKDNTSLGKFVLEDIKPAPKGKSEIEVTFDIDANGILDVSAKDKHTGKLKKVRVVIQ